MVFLGNIVGILLYVILNMKMVIVIDLIINIFFIGGLICIVRLKWL